jgi:hypothetical protein
MKTLIALVMMWMTLSAEMFSQGSTSLGIKLGSVSISNQNYTVVGLSGNYFILDDLSVGVGYERWFSASPSIQKLTAESSYFIPVDENIRPYVGVLYRHIFVSNFDNINAYGYRAGLAIVNQNLLISGGIVQERYESRTAIFDKTHTYAEVVVGFFF